MPPRFSSSIRPIHRDRQHRPKRHPFRPRSRALFLPVRPHLNQDKLAAQEVAAGKNGGYIRNYYASTVGLSSSDFQVLHDTALPCRTAVAQQDDAALLVIKDFRTRAAAAHAAGAPLPPAPPELTIMQQQRNNIVLGCVDQLKQKMTSPGFQKLDQFVHQELAKHVKVRQPGALIRKN
jgi:hypothetical protein